MLQMQVTLATIFISRLLVINLTACAYPLWQSYLKASKGAIGRPTAPPPAANDNRATLTLNDNNNSLSITDMRPTSTPHVDLNAVYGHQSEGQVRAHASVDLTSAKNRISEVELYFYMPDYHEMLGTLNDYSGRLHNLIHFIHLINMIHPY